jgi:hypothetical protein
MTLARFFLCFIFLAAFARGEVYEPKPGTPERKAIMDAMRGPVSKQIGEPVEFTGTVKLSGAWARFEGHVGTKSGKPAKKEDARFELELDFFALLRNEKGEWKVLSWGFAGDISAYLDAKKKFPDAPKDLMPELPH